MNIRDKIIAQFKNAMETKSHIGTWYTVLEVANGNRWAFVMAWMDWNNTNDWDLYGMIAYQSTNSIMQCDFDVDWLMPVANDGEIDNTMTSIASEVDIDWLLEQWERMRKEYIDADT